MDPGSAYETVKEAFPMYYTHHKLHQLVQKREKHTVNYLINHRSFPLNIGFSWGSKLPKIEDRIILFQLQHKGRLYGYGSNMGFQKTLLEKGTIDQNLWTHGHINVLSTPRNEAPSRAKQATLGQIQLQQRSSSTQARHVHLSSPELRTTV